ncbi:MAG: hypothetical protein PVF76_05290 [Syntrophobacterales bacterium]|jgi:hypothetical protein
MADFVIPASDFPEFTKTRACWIPELNSASSGMTVGSIFGLLKKLPSHFAYAKVNISLLRKKERYLTSPG